MNKNENKPDNEKEMVAPSAKKIAKFSKTSQPRKKPTAAKCGAKSTKKREVISNDFEETTKRKAGKEDVHREKRKPFGKSCR